MNKKHEKRKMTADDASSLLYFHEKGDIERLCNLSDFIDDLNERFPELMAAYEQVEIAKRTLDIVIRAVVEKVYAEEEDPR